MRERRLTVRVRPVRLERHVLLPAPMAGASQAVARAHRESPEARTREGGHATVRELLPWHADHATGQASAASPSGIRLAEVPASEVSPVAELVASMNANDGAIEAAPESSAPLSFQVYSLADLDARRPEADPAFRMSRVMFELAPRPKGSWAVVGERGRELAAEAATWALAYARTKQRPSVEPLRARSAILRGALAGALRTVDWRRVSVYGGASLATVVALLAIVLTVADLTDDLKPARATREVAADASPKMPALEAVSAVSTAARAEVAGTGAAPPAVAAPTVTEAAPSPIELDDAAFPSAPVAVARPVHGAARPRAAKPAAPRAAIALSGSPLPGGPLSPGARAPATGKGAAKGKLAYRDADEVFRP